METLYVALIIGLGGALVSFATELAKKLKVHPRVLVAGFSIVLGLIYQLWMVFVPAALQIHAAEFIGGAMMTATFVYEWFLKDIFKGME